MVELSYGELKELRTQFSRVIPRKVNLALLQSILFEVFEQGLRLQATNLDETIIYHSSDVSGPTMQFLLDFDSFKRIAAGVKRGESVQMETSGDGLKVTYPAQAELSLAFPIAKANDFPLYKSCKEDSISFDLGSFCEGYRSCVVAASSDPDKLVMNSVFFDCRERKLISTDGRRLVHVDCELALQRDMILPVTRTLKSSKIFHGEGRLQASGTAFQLECGQWTYQCKQMEGNYPNWRQVVSPPGDEWIELQSGDDVISLLSQLRSNEKGSCINLHSISNELYLVASEAQGFRSALVPQAKCTRAVSPVSLDAGFLLDALKVCHYQPVIYIRDSHSPVLVRSADQRECIIMPLRGTDTEKISMHLQKKYENINSNRKEKSKMEKSELKVVESVNPLEEIYNAIESVTEGQTEARTKADEVAKIIRDCQLGLKAINRMIKAYEKSNARKLKEYQQMQQLIGKLKLAAA